MQIPKSVKCAMKIKVRSLAAEMQMIHREENRQRAESRDPATVVRQMDSHRRRAALVEARPPHGVMLANGADSTRNALFKHEQRRLEWGNRCPDELKRGREEALAAFASLRTHRYELKGHARISHLAYGCVRGVPYRAMEAKTKDAPDFDAILKMLQRFLGRDRSDGKDWSDELKSYVATWISDAKAYIAAVRKGIATMPATGPKMKLSAGGELSGPGSA